MSKTAVVLDHGEYPKRGFIEERADQRGFRLVAVDSTAGSALPNADEVDLVIVLGSDAGAHDDTLEWVRRELGFIENALDVGTPVFGICFGGQLLARAMGGTVIPGEKLEVGWRAVNTADPDLVPEGPWLELHSDEFTVPPGAREIARNHRGVQAFIAERAAGVQFHPEVDSTILNDWLVRGATRGAPQVDLEALRRETADRAGHARRLAHQLFDRVWERIGPETAHGQ